MINFKLKDPEQIYPAGTSSDQHLSWYLLTDGDLWLNLGDEKFYEYSKEAIKFRGGKDSPYNDYYIARFIEDFSELFENVQEDVPHKMFELTNDLEKLRADAIEWWDLWDIDDDETFDDYEALTSWIKQRTLSSTHLMGGPDISFFKRNEELRIVWDSKYILENGVNLWSSIGGKHDMNSSEFIEEVRKFGQDFFSKMDNQVELALKMDSNDVELDKQRLIEEHRKRKNDFHSAFKLLRDKGVKKTNWKKVEALFDKMKDDLEKD